MAITAGAGKAKAKIVIPRRIQKKRQILGGTVIGLGGAARAAVGGSARGVIRENAPFFLQGLGYNLADTAKTLASREGYITASGPRRISTPRSTTAKR